PGDGPEARGAVRPRRQARAGGARGARHGERGRPGGAVQGDLRRERGGGVVAKGGFDMSALMKQAQQMQEQMTRVQEEVAHGTVDASAGGGMVTVKATGAGEISAIKIDPKAIDPDDPELLEDMILAAVNEALRSAQALAQSKMGAATGLGALDLGNLGLPGL